MTRYKQINRQQQRKVQMKTRYPFTLNTILCGVLTVILCACGGQDNLQNNDSDTVRSLQSEHKSAVDSESEDELSQAESNKNMSTSQGNGTIDMGATTENAATQELEADDMSELEDWKRAYLQYLNELEHADSCTYTFIYVDDDDIPELVIDTGFEAGGCLILTYHDNVVNELQTMRLNFSYIKRGNLICNSDGLMGFYYDYVYTIRDGKWEYVAGGQYGDGPDGIQFDEHGNEIFIFHWNGEEVDETEYDKQLNAVFPKEQAVNPDEHVKDPNKEERYYILSEIRSVLISGEVTSARHRYELIVGDMTWEDAREACQPGGGYLAAVTSWEELEQIQDQMVSEGKTDIVFWVGADNDRDEGVSFGYHWLEPETGTAYDMLELFNALWGFWQKDEPSYDGLTEDGREVDEDCVMLFYEADNDRCYIKDVPNDVLSAAPSYRGRIGYICEYDL